MTIKPLIILITNIRLANRGGSEVAVRDLARGLLRRGHRPIVYSPLLGDMAKELASQGVATINDLRNLAETPDLIHAQHAVPAAEALIRYPFTPAIFVCHSFSKWVEAPVFFPQIGAYVAVDEACRDRLVHVSGIESSRVVIVPNAVDLRRVPLRPNPLPRRPKLALAFGKAAPVPEIKAACDHLGIGFNAIGYSVNRVEVNPEKELVKADLVFATARAALEALCCGCAVVICDYRGMAGMVTTRNFDSLRILNFGARSLGDAVSFDGLLRALENYDAVDAGVVSERARAEADFEQTLDRFETLYSEILTGKRKPDITTGAHERATARFLNEYLPRQPSDRRWPWTIERERLERRVVKLEARLAASQLPELLRSLSRKKDEADWLKAENTNLKGEIGRLEQEIGNVKSIAAESLGETMAAGLMELHRQQALAATSLREAISANEIEVDRLKSENGSLEGKIRQLKQEIERAKQSASDSQHQAANAKSDLDGMQRIYNSRSATFSHLIALLRTKIGVRRHKNR